MGQLNSRVKQLEDQIKILQYRIQDLVDSIEEKYQIPISNVGNNINKATIHGSDISSGLGNVLGGNLVWNTSELTIPPCNTEPTDPSTVEGAEGYNKHSHSRFSGGALIKDVLEIVEYVWGSITNKHSPQYWQEEPEIATEINSNGETVKKRGLLDLVFNPDTKKWGVASYEIDIKKCYLVERDKDGNIALDSKGQQKKSPLYNSDTNKTSVVWDELGNCFRLYAVYAPGG